MLNTSRLAATRSATHHPRRALNVNAVLKQCLEDNNISDEAAAAPEQAVSFKLKV